MSSDSGSHEHEGQEKRGTLEAEVVEKCHSHRWEHALANSEADALHHNEARRLVRELVQSQ